MRTQSILNYVSLLHSEFLTKLIALKYSDMSGFEFKSLQL